MMMEVFTRVHLKMVFAMVSLPIHHQMGSHTQVIGWMVKLKGMVKPNTQTDQSILGNSLKANQMAMVKLNLQMVATMKVNGSMVKF